jgi:hypothetical protein
MIILVHFDWNGSTKALKKWNQQFKEACEKHDIKFKDLHIPLANKFNFTWVLESENVDKYMEAARTLTRPQAMTHVITEFLLEKNLD